MNPNVAARVGGLVKVAGQSLQRSLHTPGRPFGLCSVRVLNNSPLRYMNSTPTNYQDNTRLLTTRATFPKQQLTTPKYSKPIVIASHYQQAGPGKIHPLGEDACYITRIDHTVSGMGVADGVGGWANEGVDAGEYARTLMQNCDRYTQQNPDERCPKTILTEAHAKMPEDLQGSCTACVVVFENDTLRFANLGDSGLYGYRTGESEPFIRTKEQQHRWNCPKQLGLGTGDKPSMADTTAPPRTPTPEPQEEPHKVKVKRGDIIVLATDGFFDNLSDSKIHSVIERFVQEEQPNADERHKKLYKIPIATATSSATPSSSPSSSTAASPLPSRTPSPSPSSTSSSSPSPQPALTEDMLSGNDLSPPTPLTPGGVSSQSRILFSSSPCPSTDSSSASSSPSNSTASSRSPTPSPSPTPSSTTPWIQTLDQISLDLLAKRLVKVAFDASQDKRSPTPFSIAARKEGKRFQGGKEDDITVVVAQILETKKKEEGAETNATINTSQPQTHESVSKDEQ